MRGFSRYDKLHERHLLRPEEIHLRHHLHLTALWQSGMSNILTVPSSGPRRAPPTTTVRSNFQTLMPYTPNLASKACGASKRTGLTGASRHRCERDLASKSGTGEGDQGIDGPESGGEERRQRIGGASAAMETLETQERERDTRIYGEGGSRPRGERRAGPGPEKPVVTSGTGRDRPASQRYHS